MTGQLSDSVVVVLSDRYVGVLDLQVTGNGTNVWVGELRTRDDGRLVPAWVSSAGRHGITAYQEGPATRSHHMPARPVTTAATPEEVLLGLHDRVKLIGLVEQEEQARTDHAVRQAARAQFFGDDGDVLTEETF